MWKIIKINDKCIKLFKDNKETIIIYMERDLWKGNVLGAGKEVSASTYEDVLKLVLDLARDCGWY